MSKETTPINQLIEVYATFRQIGEETGKNVDAVLSKITEQISPSLQREQIIREEATKSGEED